MIRGMIRRSVGGGYRLFLLPLGLIVDGETPQSCAARATDWLAEQAGPEPEATVIICGAGGKETRIPCEVRCAWTDPALLEAVRLQRGKKCPTCHG